MTDEERIENLEREVAALKEALAHVLTATSKMPTYLGTALSVSLASVTGNQSSEDQQSMGKLFNQTQEEYRAALAKAVELIWEEK